MRREEKTYFDSHAESYPEQIMAIQRTFYENAGRLLNRELQENSDVLDLGNGGVINYDYSRFKHLDCADIVVNRNAQLRYADVPNVRFLQTDATNMSELPSENYDAVILQTLIHHLAGPSYRETKHRVRAALEECNRVLRVGGKLLVMESTVAPWFNRLEKVFFPIMQVFFHICRFGNVYQFSPDSLGAMLEETNGMELSSTEMVDIGPNIWIMGHSVPTRLTPCGACFFVLRKRSN